MNEASGFLRNDGSMATLVSVDNFVRAETDRMFAALSARAAVNVVVPLGSSVRDARLRHRQLRHDREAPHPTTTVRSRCTSVTAVTTARTACRSWTAGTTPCACTGHDPRSSTAPGPSPLPNPPSPELPAWRSVADGRCVADPERTFGASCATGRGVLVLCCRFRRGWCERCRAVVRRVVELPVLVALARRCGRRRTGPLDDQTCSTSGLVG